MEQVATTFVDDTAKSDPWKEDALGFAPFAQRLAQVLRGLDAAEGYVIGLHGAWGTGKTTALNFTCAYIEQYNNEAAGNARPLEVIEFRPWLISGHKDLIESFFKILSESLNDKAHKRAKAKKKWLGATKDVSDHLVDAAAAIGMSMAPNDAPVIKAGAAATKTSTKNVIENWLSEPSLQASYKTLIERLKESDRRFLIVIDDIDRLHADEIRAIMQMVKSIGRLPRTVYLLSYDRRIVWSALDGHLPRAPGDPYFIEKIVQHELELPAPGRDALLRLLDQHIGFITSEVEGASIRWFHVVQSGIYRWIRAPRDVFRFANALQFAWPPLKGEVDPLDIVAMEGLRIFEPGVFDIVRNNRDFLLGDGAFRMTPEEKQAAAGERIRSALPAESRDDCLEILMLLFPSRAKLLSGRNNWFGGEAWPESVKRRGVTTKEGFDAYFSLFASPNAMLKTDVDLAFGSSDLDTHRSLLAKALASKGVNGKSLIDSYLTELRARLYGRVANPPGRALLDALLEQGETILAIEYDEAFILSPNAQWRFLIDDVLRAQLASNGQASTDAFFIAAIDARPSATVTSNLFVVRAQEHGEIPSHGSPKEPVISKDGLDQLAQRTLTRIEAEAESGELVRTSDLGAVLTSWRYLSGPAPARAWVAASIETSAKFAAETALLFMSYSLGQPRRTYTFRHTPDPEEFDVDGLLVAAERFAEAPELSDDERDRLTTLRDGLVALRERGAALGEETSLE